MTSETLVDAPIDRAPGMLAEPTPAHAHLVPGERRRVWIDRGVRATIPAPEASSCPKEITIMHIAERPEPVGGLP